MNGTLLDPSAMAGPLGGSEAERALVQRALETTITASMADTLASGGRRPPFTHLLEAALRRELALVDREADADAVIEAASQMQPFPEAAESIAVLREAGFGVGVLTNSPTNTARELIGASGLDLDPVLGSDGLGVFKPHPDVYAHGVAEVGFKPDQVWLVAGHWWDVMGAQRAGLRGGWVSRGEGVRVEIGPEPDASGADLLEVARKIVG